MEGTKAMDVTSQDARTSSDTVTVVVQGLARSGSNGQVGKDGAQTETLQLPRDAPITAIWDALATREYDLPDKIYESDSVDQSRAWTKDMRKKCFHPYESIEVVDDHSLVDAKHIHIDEPLIAFANHHMGVDPSSSGQNAAEIRSTMIIGGSSSSNVLDINGLFTIKFHRTVRMPDDDRLHQLPASLGLFPLYNVSAYAERLPENIVQNGGIFLPMWPREALWMSFTPKGRDPCAVRVYVGRINAVTGTSMDEVDIRSGKAQAVQDYVVVPGQQWLDGICVEEGVVRQFVAMPLGAGYTVEGQKTGDEKHGGLQIEVIPAYKGKLKLWLSGETTSQQLDDALSSPRTFLDEYCTPSELGMKPGDKLRAYPHKYFYYRSYMISELMDDPERNEVRVNAARSRYQTTTSSIERLLAPYEMREGASPLYRNTKTVGKNINSTAVSNSHGLRLADQIRSSNMASKIPFMAPKAQHRRQNGVVSSKVKLQPKDLKAMGLAAGGKLIQDIYRDPHPARIWNTAAARVVHVHLLDPGSCEKVTHIVPPPPPTSAAAYVEAKLPFFVVEEQVDNRVEGGDFDNVKSVSAMDRDKGVATEPTCDPNKPTMCTECQLRLCDCIIRPCCHQFCHVCIKKVDSNSEESNSGSNGWQCPKCHRSISHVAGFSAPMNLPGEEAMKVKVPVHVLKVEDGRVAFRSIQTMRI